MNKLINDLYMQLNAAPVGHFKGIYVSKNGDFAQQDSDGIYTDVTSLEAAMITLGYDLAER